MNNAEAANRLAEAGDLVAEIDCLHIQLTRLFDNLPGGVGSYDLEQAILKIGDGIEGFKSELLNVL